LAGKYSDDAALNQGIENITQKLEIPKEKADKLVDAMGAEEAYKYWQSQLGKGGSSDEGAADGNNEGADKDALNSDADGSDDADANADGKLDINKYSEEFADKGELSEQSYKDLADAGMNRQSVDRFAHVRAACSQKDPFGIDGEHHKAATLAMSVSILKDPLASSISMMNPLGV
jgi:hypothetical protein